MTHQDDYDYEFDNEEEWMEDIEAGLGVCELCGTMGYLHECPGCGQLYCDQCIDGHVAHCG